MTAASRRSLTARLVIGFGLALTAAACAPQGATPQASVPPASQMSLQPSGQAAASSGGGMSGMDHSNMPGMSHSNMQGMQGHNMSGMSMQDTMAHCRQMQADAGRGARMSPDMQAMMAQCSQMQSQGGSTSGGAAHRH
ncbi:hypothetical protein SAMN02745194_04715 [Roseomonas rosea]|jgi:hypothetical protein|uniref:Pentapeptide MXKDX repeat protein n=2 Tax=Roseomonadaceae TaxID=3385906 RepID=A0A1M6RL72_9PROT|nr:MULTISPECIES: hypothetical protein [Acetobacteraceae]PHK93033.1 hypothetical protein CR162_20770 [Pseudoroseomonas rhizosphaerae]PZR08349.1 MAG: hypothetical protein DI532_22085 [Azospirillum brasilense]USQ74526.1 hypothetical protein NF552_25510 [Roseomonas mucosa]SHK33179.1 hypothetical protein SAMN02745194_04715 [Roseomonas rosea]